MSATKSRHILVAAAVFSLAVTLRFAYLSDSATVPFFDHPIMDASYHDDWARRIAGGELVGSEPFFRAPLYPYALAAVYKLSDGSYLAPRVLQFILGGLTCVMAYILARRAIGTLAGIAAGIVCAVYPLLIYFDGELLTEPLFTFLCVLGILILDTARRRGQFRYWFLGGLVLGLALITRPTVVLFLPAAVAGAAAFSGRRWAAAAVLVAGIAVPVTPVSVHNYAVSGEFIPIVWQGGLNLYLGNNPAADGWSATSPEIRKDWWGGYNDQIAIARAELGYEPSYGEISAYWQNRAVQFMTSSPVRFLKLLLRKAALFWGSLEFGNNQDANFYKLHSWVLRNPSASFGVVAPLALLGMFALARSWRSLYFPYAFVLAYFLVTIAFFVCSRYRAPAVPMLAVFAGGGISQVADSVRRGRRARLLATLAGLTAAALFVNMNPAGVEPPGLAQSFTALGKVYVEMGEEEKAAEQFRKALTVDPRWADAYTGLGKVYVETSEEEKAAEQFQKALKADPQWADAYEQLGLIEMNKGPTDQAAAYLRKAVELMPRHAGAHRALAMLHLARGDLDEARQSVLKAIDAAPYLEDSHNILGSIERQAGRTDAALEAFKKEIEINPTNWRTHANLGSLFELIGELDKAEASYLRAIELQPGEGDLVLALAGVYSSQGRKEDARRLLRQAAPESVKEIDLRYNQAAMLQDEGSLDQARKIYEDILAEMPGHERTLVNLGVIYAKQGNEARALEMWQRALAVNPGNRTAERNTELLRKRSADSD